MKRTATGLSLLLLGGVALATTWAPSQMTDPLTSEKVPSHEIVSFGSYIYDWPSKYAFNWKVFLVLLLLGIAYVVFLFLGQ